MDPVFEGIGNTSIQNIAYDFVAVGAHCHKVVIIFFNLIQYFFVRFAASDPCICLNSLSLQCRTV